MFFLSLLVPTLVVVLLWIDEGHNTETVQDFIVWNCKDDIVYSLFYYRIGEIMILHHRTVVNLLHMNRD